MTPLEFSNFKPNPPPPPWNFRYPQQGKGDGVGVGGELFLEKPNGKKPNIS